VGSLKSQPVEGRLGSALLFESDKVGFVPAQISIEVPQVAFHRRQPRFDAIEPSIIQQDSDQNQNGRDRDAEG
jgi:hypothetical protein